MTTMTDFSQLIDAVASDAEALDLFESVETREDRVICYADGPESPAWYAIRFDHVVAAGAYDEGEEVEASVTLSWNSKDRYLSQSIESDLVYTGDDLDDMLDEELVDLGWSRGRLDPFKHYRDEEETFVFVFCLPLKQSKLTPNDAADLVKCLQAADLVFSELGDMAEDDESE